MKVRTKLVLLLSSALVVTLALSTVATIELSRKRLEEQLRDSAQDTADAIASDLKSRLDSASTEDDISEELKTVKLVHRVDAYIELALSSDEDTSVFRLDLNANAVVSKKPKLSSKKEAKARLSEARRALYDHGESSRRSTLRDADPLWRTPDRPGALLAVQPVRPTVTRGPRTFREGLRGHNPVYEIHRPFDLSDGRRGELTVSVLREPIDNLVRSESRYSAVIAGSTIFLFMLMTSLIVNRVVGKPVSRLEQAMKRVEAGEPGSLDERVEVGHSDEVGALSHGFNSMLGRLAEADREIRVFNHRLADEVRAATASLEQKNETLEQLNRLLVETRRQLGDRERLAALGQLAAQLAHEIGTPLGSVSGHLQLAIASRELPGALKDRLQVASSELTRVSKIVRDYLDSTRTVAPEWKTIEIGRIVDEACDIALSRARAQVKLAKQLAPEAQTLETDGALLRQILVNLLTNAADAVAPDGSGEIQVQVGREKEQISLSVSDNGVGIAADDAARIFEPFYTTKGRGKGTGLGLAICRELATALGGRISVDSAPGRGSTFSLVLPLLRPMT